MEPTIFAQIRKEADDYFYASISPVPGYSWNMYETIKRCHLYRNSKYASSSTYLGRDKLFFNVVNPPCEVATKMLNVDTKNIRLWPLNSKSHFATYLLEKELKQWLKTSELGKVLNQMAEEAPIYGSVFLEKTSKGAQVVDIRRLIVDPSVESITDSRFVTTVHYMTPTELRATNWKNVDVAIERFQNTAAQSPFEDQKGDVNLQVSTPYIKVHKRFGEVPKWWIDGGKSEEMVKALYIVAGAETFTVSKETGLPVGEEGVILFESKWNKEWPYRDFHYTKSKGRLLGVGVIEMLFDTQVRMNELKHQKRVSMEISTIHLFQSKDKQIVRNILTDLESGDLLISPNGIEPIANEERNLAAFTDEEQSYITQADKLSFAYDAVRGDSPPSSTPLGTTQIVTAQATSVFGFKRENYALMLREFFNELVMPQLLKDMTPEHIMRFTGSPQELMKIDQAAAEIHANNFIKARMLNSQMITPDEIEQAKETYIQKLRRNGTNRFLEIKKSFYSDAEYDFDYIIDNEQADPQTLATNIQTVLAPLMQNFGIDDPRVKLLYNQYAQILGINPAELELADQQAQDMQANQQQNEQQQKGQQSSILQGQKQATPAPAQARV